METYKPKILLLDIETLPNLFEVLKVFPQLSDYPGLTLKATINSVICFGYKWLGDKKARVLNAWDYPAWKKDVNNDKSLLIDAQKLVDEADCVVTHNGKRFDWKFLNTRLLYNSLTPLPLKLPHIDCCQVSKSNLFAFNNRLGTIAKLLKTVEKLDNGGWPLWEKVYHRDPKSMKKMSSYCAGDVEALEKIFLKLRPFISQLPNFNLIKLSESCENCGSNNLMSAGKKLKKTGYYYRYQCKDCGSWKMGKLFKKIKL